MDNSRNSRIWVWFIAVVSCLEGWRQNFTLASMSGKKGRSSKYKLAIQVASREYHSLHCYN